MHRRMVLGLLGLVLLAGCGGLGKKKYAVEVQATNIAGKVVLKNNGTDALTIQSPGTYAFSQKLYDGASYLVTVEKRPFFRNCVLTDAAGTISKSNALVKLACPLKAWQASQEVGDAGTSPGTWAQVAAAWPSGDAVVAWAAKVGASYRLHARTYSGGSWQAAVKVAESGDGLGLPALASGPEGEALLVWYENVGGSLELRWSRLSGGSWTTPATLAGPITWAGPVPPALDMNENGQAIVVWAHNPGPGFRVYARRYANGAWSSSVNLDNGSAQGAYPAVAVAEDGSALAAWMRVDGGNAYVSANRYEAGAWQGEEVLSGAFNSQTLPSVAVEGGRGLVTWWQTAPGETKVFAATYEGSWSGPELLGSDASGSAAFPQAGLDAEGRGLVVWTQDQGGTRVVTYATYENGWQPGSVLSPNTGGDADPVSLALDKSGHGVAVWAQASAVGDVVHATRFTKGAPDAPEVITAPGVIEAVFPEVALAPTGDAVAIWWQDDGNQRVYANLLR